MKKDFSKFISTLKNSIKTWDYFVNWKKVFANRAAFEITLNKLNYLLGKENLKEEFERLYQGNPDIIKTLPVLLAVREEKLEVYDLNRKQSEFFDFTNTKMPIDDAYAFLVKSGLDKLFKKGAIKNLVDYVTGVEVGLDSNGRKNRGGKLMENIVETFIKEFAANKGLKYLVRANAAKIKERWGVSIKVNKSSRSFDVAVFNPSTKKLRLIETNFYNGGGSKLKSVCGEFRDLYNELKIQNIEFIWITDGLGWKTAERPLEETYNNNDYVFNLNMLEAGVLDELVW